ncbi:MAG TPA: serine/threonine-protein kinase, partial [Polyangiaceae bacterium]|nr:serine/threonine-protein kinase [Polyangiaceae bacterium]
MALAVGDLLQGRYRVGAPLGQGGMASVFAAEEEPEGTDLVVKQLRLDAPELLDAFRGEFGLLSRVTDPHLLRVLDFGSERLRGELHHYYVAERVEGVTAGARARRGASVAELTRAVLDAASGLMTLHQASIRHGDFTPENVLVDGQGRGVLIDLGCARPFGVTEQLAGTEGFLAPELLEGRAGDARSDLFGVGRTLQELLRAGGHTAPPNLARVVERLVRPEPDARLADCGELLEALGRKPRALALPRVPAQLLGRDAELESFEAWLAAFAAGDAGPRVLALSGAAGMGLSRLLRELTWRAQLRVSVLRSRPAQPLGRLLALALGVGAPVSSRRGLLSALTMLAERSEPLLLVVEDVDRLDSEQRELVFSLVRSLEPRGNLGLLLSARSAPAGAGVLELHCGPLSPAAVAAWASPWLTDKRLRELQHATGGCPARIDNALREQFGAVTGASGEANAALRAVLSALPARAREALALLATQRGELASASFGLEWPELEPLLEQRLLERDGDVLRLVPAARAALAAGALAPGELERAHLRAADWFSRLDASGQPEALRSARVIHHLTLGQQLPRAEASFASEKSQLERGPRSVAELLLPLASASRDPELLLALAALLLEQGLPRAAVTAASRAARQGKHTELARRGALIVSDALVRLGRPARAELLLGGLWAAGSTGASLPRGAEVLQRLARARLSRGDYVGAKSTAEAALEQGPAPEVAGLVRETLGVACAYL